MVIEKIFGNKEQYILNTKAGYIKLYSGYLKLFIRPPTIRSISSRNNSLKIYHGIRKVLKDEGYILKKDG